ncbi:MAG: hypothetical protein E6G74_10455 [Alphaproteobacteria bacterium]|nr:MAG: hypothetical protein E6G74_10455 [Alphaproteobacteria bacterium]
MARYRVTVDTGGTFSDFVALNEETGKLSIAKLPSTPDDPSRAIIAGIEELIATAGESTEIGYFCHGTTVGTNALLEGKGAGSISAEMWSKRSTRRRCAKPCASSPQRTSGRWRSVCCSRSFIPRTKRACARSCAKRYPSATSRSPARCCRRSASTID